MGRDRAAYMREYRRHKRTADLRAAGMGPDFIPDENTGWMMSRIVELEAEVKHLKAELAKRPVPHAFNTRPFTPVPKRKS